jgi:parallel beta-helix repeat protein
MECEMNKKLVCTFLVFILLAFTVFLQGTWTRISASRDAPRIYVNPLISYAGVGETFSIDVSVDDVTNLYGFEFKLAYNTTFLNALEIVFQPFLNEPIYVLREEISDEFGFVWIAATSQYPAEAVSGSGNLVSITFQVIDGRECVLDLYDTKLSDPGGFPIDHSAEDAFYEGGMTQVVSTESTLGSYHTSLAVDPSGNVHVAWHDETDLDCGPDLDIFYKRYQIGVGWTPTEVVSTESNGTSAYPSLAVDPSGNVHVAWHDNTTDYAGCGTDSDIFYKRRHEVSGEWTSTEVVSTESTGNSFRPSLTVDSTGNLHVAWDDETDYAGCGTDSDIFYKRYDGEWTPTQVVSTESNAASWCPSLAVDLVGDVYIAWDDRNNSDWTVFYRRFEVGRNWTSTQVVSTESTAHSWVASLAVDSSRNMHIAWHDETDYAGCGTDSDIFYKYLRLHSTQYPWTMFHHNLRHTGCTESPAPRTNQTLWNYTTAGAVESSPAVADGTVFIGSNDGNVYALDQHTGAHIWNYTTGGAVKSSPAVADGRVYVGSDDFNVYCLDASTGAEIWINQTGGIVQSSPAVADGRVYVGSLDHKVHCLNASTGEHIWNYTTGGDVLSSPAVAEGKVFAGSGDFDGKVYCLDASTGAHLWNRTTGYVYSSPAVVAGRVYVGSGNNVRCLNASTGANIWIYPTGLDVYSSPAVVAGRVYVGSRDNKVYCLDASTGGLIWNYTIGNIIRSSSPAVADGKVYVGSFDGRVYCLDAFTGTHIWNYTTGGHVDSSPAVADGVLFVGSNDHVVYAFGNVLRVPEDYPTVQEAINEADEGATIIIAPGTYHESIVINKTLTILGTEGSSSDFDGGGSGIAFTIQPDAPGTIIDNVVITNWDQGIFVNNTNNCEIYGNIMYYMGDSGIVIEGNNAADNLIESNVIYSNNIAINLTESSTSNIIYNNIISNNYCGINMTNSNGNTIYWNSFIDNTYAQVITSNSIDNTWDNGYEGNYWSNYAGTDADGDGIGDTPHIIDGDNQDNYPLMSPYEYWSNPMVGDVNKDMKVDQKDLMLLAEAYGSTAEKPNWNPNCDFNKDNKIAVLDLFDLSKNYGKAN